jgi:urease accessory protein
MRSRVVVVARAGRDGSTELATLEAHGALAVRRTGPEHVHVVGTAAGPIGGDEIDVLVDVGPGARLELLGVAATIALPGREPVASHVRLDVAVGPGASAVVALPPLVVTSRATVLAATQAHVDGVLDLTERIQLGRHDEAGGTWTGRLLADVDGRPAIRQTQRSAALLASGWSGLVTRALLGPGVEPVTATCLGEAFAVPLATGGTLWTSVGNDLAAADRGFDRLAQPPTTAR